MAQFWESAPIVDAPSPQPVIDLRDPSKAEGSARDQVRTDIAVRGEQRDIETKSFEQARALRRDFENLPEVGRYKTIISQYASALGADNSAEGDQLLINAYAQMLNPTSTVMLGEYQATEQNQTTFDQIKSRIARELKFDGAGRLMPESRTRIYSEMQNLAATANQSYSLRRKEFGELSQSYGFQPEVVIGRHAGEPFAERIEAYWGKKKSSRTANEPEMVGGLAKGTQVTFAGDGGGFDRRKWLLETQGFDPNGEANLVAWLNANSGNPNVTMEDLDNAYRRFSEGRSGVRATPEMLQRLRSGEASYSGFDSSQDEKRFQDQVNALAAERDTMGGALDAGVRGFADTASLGLADKASAFFTGGTQGYDEALAQERLINAADEQVNPLARILGQLGGAVALPVGAGAKTPAELAKVAGGTGGAYSFISSDRDLTDPMRYVNAGIDAATGAALGYGTGKVAEAAAPVVGNMVSRFRNSPTPQPTVDAARIVQAGAEEGVPVNRAMVAPELSNKLTAAESTMSGGPTIRGGMQEVSEAIEGRAGALSKGTALDPYVAGERIQGAVKRADKKMKSETDRLYEAYRKASGDPPVTPQSALQQIDAEIAELQKSPKTNSGEIGYLTDLKADLSKGDLTVDTLLNLRRSMRGQIRERNLGLTQAEARVQRVLKSAGDDIAKALDPKSPAFNFLQRANKAHGEHQVFKRQILKDLIGTDRDIPIDPEKAFQKFQQWSKPGADGNRLIATWKKFDADEAADVASTVAETLGRDKGGVFSPALFVSQVERLNDRARVTMFGPEGKRSIENLVELSNQYKRVTGNFNNSKSGVALNSSPVRQGILTAIGATGGGFAGGTTGMAVGAALASTVMAKSWLSARALMSKDVSKWLNGLSKKPNQPAALAHIKRLDNIAKAEPVIANEVIQLQSRLRDAFGQGQLQAAASSDDQRTEPLPMATTNTAGGSQ